MDIRRYLKKPSQRLVERDEERYAIMRRIDPLTAAYAFALANRARVDDWVAGGHTISREAVREADEAIAAAADRVFEVMREVGLADVSGFGHGFQLWIDVRYIDGKRA